MYQYPLESPGKFIVKAGHYTMLLECHQILRLNI